MRISTQREAQPAAVQEEHSTLRATLHVPRSRLVMLWTCRCLWQVSSARPRQPRLSVFLNTCHCNPFEALLIRNSQLTLFKNLLFVLPKADSAL